MEKQKCPLMRFKGFNTEWEENILGGVTTFINGRAYSQEELLKKGKYPVLRVGNFNTNSHWYYSDLELGAKYYAEEGDLLYTWSTIFSPYIWKGEKVIYHYHIWKLELSKKLDKLFTFHFLKADESALTNNTNGSTMIHVTKGEMESKTIHIPLLGEQEKIGLFFESLNTKISLQEKKLSQTQNLKKAMLEKMFPKAGSKQPEIRLKGFSGDWEHNRLGSITTFINGRAYRQEELLKQGKYPVLRVGNFNTNSYWYFSDLELDQKYYAEYGDLLYTWSTAFSPYIWNGKKVIYHYHIWKIELSSELDKLFTLYFLKADEIQLTNNTNGSTMIHVTKGEMENKIIVYPSLEEQNAIGRFFKQLDETLVLQQQQLQTLKNLKQAFLEKMFV